MKKFFLFFVLFPILLYPQSNGGIIVADTPGAYGSYWHTSLTLTNLSNTNITLNGSLYLADGRSFKVRINLSEKQSISKHLIDILKENGIDLQSFFGWLEIDILNLPEELLGFSLMYTPDPNAKEGAIFAEITPMFFGETEFMLYPLTPCGAEAKEPMALGGAVWRTNVGFVNTSTQSTTVEMECYDSNGTLLARVPPIALNPKQIMQLNDVKRPEIWNLPCNIIKEPVFCFGNSQNEEAKIYVYAANVNNENNFPVYISPQ